LIRDGIIGEKSAMGRHTSTERDKKWVRVGSVARNTGGENEKKRMMEL
jgi:hypothetical protein